MSFLMDSNSSSTSLYHQLLQRENNIKSQNQPRTFQAHLYRERLRVAKNLYKTDLIGHYGCVNAIEFSHGGQFLASGGDDKRVLIWNIERSLAGIGRPRALDTEHASNIFCLGFDSQNHKLISGGNDDLVISHDFETGKLDNVFKQDNPVYGLSIDPQNDSIFATASENGKVLLFDQRADPTDPFVVADLRSSFHAVEFHPAGGNLLITANSKHGAALYDIRKPNQAVMRYRHFKDPPTCMSVRFNRTGNLILALRRRLPPILYRLHSSDPTCTFYHKNYYNSCTMKSCTFAGEDDELVLSGSDDFNLYIWSPFSQHNWSGSLLEEATCSDNPREIFSPFFVNVMTVSSLSHDYSSRNTNEDPRMLAFFDSLIRQEIDGLESNISTDSSIETESGSSSNLSLDSSSSSSSSSDSSSTSTDSDGDDGNNDNNQIKTVLATGGTAAAAAAAAATPTPIRGNSNSKRIIRRRLITRRRVQRIKRSHFENMKHIFKIRQPKQQHKKRIGYLIPKSSRTLRLLALEGGGGTLSHNRYNTTNQSRRLQRGHSLLRLKNSDKPTTSAAAATISSASSSHKKKNQKRKSKVQKYIDSTVSSEENSATTTTTTTNNNTLRPLTNNTQAVVPSTSTGITTSLRVSSSSSSSSSSSNKSSTIELYLYIINRPLLSKSFKV
uniref:WD_REPEATS_REGION domain-containing protein n=1 Tax=Glossina brevipalpis TaxID=37001 RepID=A0A1A9WB78_9MUSC